MIFARKINKNSGILRDFARKMPEFYVIIARQIFSPVFVFFGGGGACPPCPPSPTPMDRLSAKPPSPPPPSTVVGDVYYQHVMVAQHARMTPDKLAVTATDRLYTDRRRARPIEGPAWRYPDGSVRRLMETPTSDVLYIVYHRLAHAHATRRSRW